jgi:AcrR family transcriptional regulator
MARVVKAHGVRRDELLDAAQFLVITKGYAQMTVQDVMAHCAIAKGTFYHYFDTKQALLEAMLERRLAELEGLAAPIVDAPGTRALDKLRQFFLAVASWKHAQQDFFVSLMPILLSDDNAHVVHRARAMLMARVRPLLVRLMVQGRGEGLALDFEPGDAADLLLSLFETPQRALAALLQRERDPEQVRAAMLRTFAACSRAVERVLGAPPGSLPVAGDMPLDDTAVALVDRLQGDPA